MDTRADFQRLLEDMDKVIQSKRKELLELDERLEAARGQLSEREARELRNHDPQDEAGYSIRATDDHLQEQRTLYESQIAQLGDELNELDSINQELFNENVGLKQELHSTRADFERFRASTLILNETLEEVKKANLGLNLRLARAESEVQVQQKLLKKSNVQDAILMDAFNDKLESLRRAIELRDEEIERLRLDNQFTLESFGIDVDEDLDSERLPANQAIDLEPTNQVRPARVGLIDSARKQKVIQIASAFREKDNQIELLKSQLLQATKDLENNANLLESLAGNDKVHLDGSQFNLALTSERSSRSTELVSRCKMLEDELESKDKQLHLVEFRNRHFEALLPNMVIDLVHTLTSKSKGDDFHEPEIKDKVEKLVEILNRTLNELSTTQDLLDDIDRLKFTIETKDAQLKRLVDDLNYIDAKNNDDPHVVQPVEPEQPADGETFMAAHETESILPSATSREEEEPQQPASGAVNQIAGQVEPPIESVDLNLGGSSNEGGAAECQVENTGGSGECLGQQSIKIGSASALISKTKASDNRPESAITESEPDSSQAAASATSESSPKSVSGMEGSIREGAAKGEVAATVKVKTLTSSRINRRAHYKPKPTATATATATTSIDCTRNLQSRLRQLENENELLELAMKEILLSIKWSDAKCSAILIDCPSLERLCQLIEAKFMADRTIQQVNGMSPVNGSDGATGQTSGGDFSENKRYSSEFFQLVVLKSELDLLRGHNEQLRADIKTQRREYLEFLQSSTKSLVMKQMEDDSDGKIVERPTTEHGGDCRGLVPDDCGRCQNCVKFARLTNELLKCIVRVETRVNMSDEIFLSRLSGLYKLSRRLENDLISSDELLARTRRNFRVATEEKLLLESRLRFMEQQLRAHVKTCPLIQSPDMMGVGMVAGAASLVSDKRGHEETEGNKPTFSGVRHVQYPMQSPQSTICLLQSIIGCLQARLDFKDERLCQLETLHTSLRSTNDDMCPS